MSNITFKFVTVPGGLARRMSFPAVPTWADLSGKLEGSFTIPKASLAISYIDTDGDTIVVSSDAELRDCVQFAAPAPGKTSDTGECKTIIRCKVLDLGLLRGAGTERPSARPAVTAASDGESDIASSATAESIQGPAEKGKEKEEGQVKGKDETEGSDGVAKGAHDRAAPAGSFANDERMEEDARASIGSSDIEDFRILDDDVDEEMFGSAELLGGARVRGQGRILDENQTDEHTAGNHHSFAHGASRFEPYGRGRGGFGRGGRGGFRGASRGGFGRGGLTSTTVPPAEPTDESPADAPPQASSSPGRGRGGFRGGRGGRGRGRGGQSFMCVDGHFEHGYPCPSAIRHEQGDFNGPHGHAPGAHMPPLPPAHNPWFHPHSHYGGMPMPPFPPPFPSQHTGAFSSPPPPPTGLFPTNEPGSVSPAPEV